MAVSIAWKMSHVPLPSPTLTPPPRPPALLRAATCLANPSLSFPTLLRSWGQKARPFCFRSGFLLRETTSRFPRWRPRGSLLSQRAAACPFPRPSETLLSHVKPRRALGTSLCLAQALTAWGATGDGDGEAGSPGTLNDAPVCQGGGGACHVPTGDGCRLRSSRVPSHARRDF